MSALFFATGKPVIDVPQRNFSSRARTILEMSWARTGTAPPSIIVAEPTVLQPTVTIQSIISEVSAFQSVEIIDDQSTITELTVLQPAVITQSTAGEMSTLQLSINDAATLHLSVQSDGDSSGTELDDSLHDEDYVGESSNSTSSSDDTSSSEDATLETLDSPSTETGRSRKRERTNVLKKGRKRARNVDKWESTIRRKNKEGGLPYKTRTGRDVPQKEAQYIDCTKCRFHCADKFSSDKRNECCQYYYSIDNNRNKDFLCKMVKVASIDRRRRGHGQRPKNHSCSYYLPTGCNEERVCQKFFCKTLAISKKSVNYAIKHKNELGQFCEPNLKKGLRPSNKTSDLRTNFVHEHISSFPLVESHYCRANSSAQYLSPELSIAEMYRLYKGHFCSEKNITDPVTFGVYRRIFVTDYNIRFFVPKKDQCSTCNGYYEATTEDKVNMQSEWEAHKMREKEAMDMKKVGQGSSCSKHIC
jgi:hypothetical protein